MPSEQLVVRHSRSDVRNDSSPSFLLIASDSTLQDSFQAGRNNTKTLVTLQGTSSQSVMVHFSHNLPCARDT